MDEWLKIRSRTNGGTFADNNLKWVFKKKMIPFRIKFNFSVFQSLIYEPLPATFLMQWNAMCAALADIILCMCSANERRCYIITPPLIGWTHTKNNPWVGPECMNAWCAAKCPHMKHYSDVIMSRLIRCRSNNRHQSSASLAFVRGIHRWPVKSPHKGPVTQKIFPFDDVTMKVFILAGWWCFDGGAKYSERVV